MGQQLTAARRAQLIAAAKAGNRDQYYSLLASWGYDYGKLALGVVRDNGPSGTAANAYARSVAKAQGKSFTSGQWADFSAYLMELDLEARLALPIDSADDLSWVQQRENHRQAFRDKLGLPISAWTAYIPLQLAALPGGVGADALWQQMLSSQGFFPEVGNGLSTVAFVGTFNRNAYKSELAEWGFREDTYPEDQLFGILLDNLTGTPKESSSEQLARFWLNHVLSGDVVGAMASDTGSNLIRTVRGLTGISYLNDENKLVPAIYQPNNPENTTRRLLSSALRSFDETLLIPDQNGDIIGYTKGFYDIFGAWHERERRVTVYAYDDLGQMIKDAAGNGIRIGEISKSENITVETGFNPGTSRVISSNVSIPGNRLGLEFSDVAAALGSQLGSFVVSGNRIAGTLVSPLFSTVAADLGDILDGIVTGGSLGVAIDRAFKDFDGVLLSNLQASGIGAISSFLTAELVKVLGIDGFAGELANTAGGAVIQQIIGQLGTTNPLSGVGSALTLGSAVGSFLGAKLASVIISFDTIGGQLGSAVGSSLGVIAATKLLTIGTALGGPIGAAIGAFVGFIAGGLIGSAFGGTPRSGADVLWDNTTQRFVTGNAYSRKGGSKEAAIAIAGAVGDTFNAVLEAAGGRLLAPASVQAGNYGMRADQYVYRSSSTRDANSITASFAGKNAPERLIQTGIYAGLTAPAFKIVGGDVYIKRALQSTLESGSRETFESGILLSNISVAQRYEQYLLNGSAINALLTAEPDSAFSAEWIVTLARASELGLDRRSVSDWFGGFGELATEIEKDFSLFKFGFERDEISGRVSRLIVADNVYLGDPIAVAGQDVVIGTTSNDWIDVSGTVLTAATAERNVGLTFNGIAHGSFARAINIAAIVEAGDGDDFVQSSNRGDNVFGGKGNDVLYGGTLDDWLLGGDGDDTIEAGGQSGGIGGDGNYLDGGKGNDLLIGREGADWLEGGEGADRLDGGTGNDVLAGGAGDGDEVRGGAGNDSYLFRRGDGADNIEDVATGGPVADASQSGDAISQRFARIASGAIGRNWLGTTRGVTSNEAEINEDAIHFGIGIELGDLRIKRSSDGLNLVIQLTQLGSDGKEQLTGDEVTVRDWFANPFKRIEWLKFVDGTEVRIGDVTSFVVGAADNDVLFGTAGNDFVYGGAGADKLYLLAGDDIGSGGTGDDMVSGGDDADLLIGGLGDDDLLGGGGNDTISGDAGADQIYGGAGNDLLSGGRGSADELVGGAGDDRFKFSRGDGHDTMFDDFAADGWQTVLTGDVWGEGFIHDKVTGEVTTTSGEYVRRKVLTANGPDYQWVGRFDYDPSTGVLKRYATPTSGPVAANSGLDTLEFALDINIQDIVLLRAGDDLVLVVGQDGSELGNSSNAADSVTIKDWFKSGLQGQIEQFAFYQTGILDVRDRAGNTLRTLIAGTDGDDGQNLSPLTGTSGDDWITGAAGSDVIAGGAGNDIIAGNSGADTLRGEAGDDVLYGGTGNDILEGGAGADTLSGGEGTDIASYAGSSLGVRAYLGNSDANFRDSSGDVYDSIEGLIGTSTGDRLGGDAGDNELTGSQGNDFLLGSTGNDTYIFNATDGSDQVYDAAMTVQVAVNMKGQLAEGYSVKSWSATGLKTSGGQPYYRLQIQNAAGVIVYDYDRFAKSGSNPAVPVPSEYVTSGWLGGFARANGVQLVSREVFDATVNAGEDVLELGTGLSLTDVNFFWSGDDLYVRKDNGTTHQVRLQGQRQANTRIESLQLADGFAASLLNVLVATGSGQLVGSSGDDLLAGQAGSIADDLSGGDGNDALVGYAGNDRLFGGAGNDVLEGGAGADLLDGGSNDPVASRNTAGDTARYVRSSAGVTIDLTRTDAQVGDGDASGDTLVGIENVVGSNLADRLTGDAGDNRLIGLDGADTLRGAAGDDVLVGDLGDDYLYGDDGSDAVSGGDGADQIWGGNGDDRLDGGDGADKIYGEAGKDALTGGAGDDVLDGGSEDDLLSGGEGNDNLAGGTGHDTLVGGAGNDMLSGGIGNDVYLFDANSGSDRVVDGNEANLITFDKSVSFDQLWMIRSGNDLQITVIGGSASIRLTGFFVADGTRARAVQTTTHAFFLDNKDALKLIDQMTAVGTETPATMPKSVADVLSAYWHVGGKAVPTMPSDPRAITTNEDETVVISGAYGAVDQDGGVLAYSLKQGAGPSLGVISGFDSSTGAMTYTPNADVNGTDNFTVIATDTDGQSVERQVAVVINPVNDAPRSLGIVGGGELHVVETAPGSSTAPGTLIGQFTATDPEGDLITYSLADSADARFAISSSGVLTVKDATLLDRERNAEHTIRVKASDGVASRFETFTVFVDNQNEAPSVPKSIEWRGGTSEYVKSVPTTYFNNDGWVMRYELSDRDSESVSLIFDELGNRSNRFKIVGNEVRFNFEPNFETLVNAGFKPVDGIVTLTGAVRATDGVLVSNPISFDIKIIDVNEPITSIGLSSRVNEIEERDRVGSARLPRAEVVLGTVTENDPDLSSQLFGQHDFSVYENGSSVISQRFMVTSAKRLVLIAGKSLDFETDGASIKLTVKATDRSATPLSFSQTFTFAIKDIVDVFEGGEGDDRSTGQQNQDSMFGYAGNDTLSGGAGADVIDGGAGNDSLSGDDGNDTLIGGFGSDTLLGGAGNDQLDGGEDSDLLDGGDGSDLLYGGAGDDGKRATGADYWRGFTQAGLVGGSGDDVLEGGDGDDFLDGGLGADRLVGGSGFDGVTYAGSAGGVSVNLRLGTATGGSAQGDTLSTIEFVEGSRFNDTLEGSDGSDVIHGGDGNDIITGGLGDDYLLGGAGDDQIDAQDGNDYLDGGTGNDLLIGGNGNDTYFLARNQGHDRIRNFDPSGTDFDHVTFDASIQFSDIWFERVNDSGVADPKGDHVRLTILGANGSDGSVTIENWYRLPDRDQPKNYFKVDLISDGGERATVPIYVDALVVAMEEAVGSAPPPVTRQEMTTLQAEKPEFKESLESKWGRLTAPIITNVGDIQATEPRDGETRTVSFNVQAWSEPGMDGLVIPTSGIDLEITAAGGFTLSDYVTAIDTGTPDAAGNRTVTLTLSADASGTLPLQIAARIRGTTRVSTDLDGFNLIVAPTADTPVLTQLHSAGGNAGFYLPITLSGVSSDTDGSERVDFLLQGVPANYALTDGYGRAVGVAEGAAWRLTASDVSNLHMFVPEGFSQNVRLSVTPRAIDGTSVQNGVTSTINIDVNGKITVIDMRGKGTLAAPSIDEFVTGRSQSDGIHVGVIVPTDPDTLENNLVRADWRSVAAAGQGEERTVTSRGPDGSQVDVLETGQFAGLGGDGTQQGGGVFGLQTGAVDRTKAYKYTVYVKPENGLNHTLYFGTGGGVENATTGVVDTNPYFWAGSAASLVQDRWYKIEGYVLPEGNELVSTNLFGGVFDTVTGAKISDTNVFRFSSTTTEATTRFFSYYGQQQAGYSAQWHQPVVEKLDYTYTLDSDAGGRFKVNAATGLVTAVGNAFDHEDASAYNVVARVVDKGGLTKTQSISIAVNNVNETPDAPNQNILNPFTNDRTVWSFFDEIQAGQLALSAGRPAATLTLSDVDSKNVTLKFVSNAGNAFEIVGNQVRFRNSFDYSFEALKDAGNPVFDWNNDGRLDVQVAMITVEANDGELDSPETSVKVFISDINEAPNKPVITSSTVWSAPKEGNAGKLWGETIAAFALSDPDGTTPNLRLASNPGGWFALDGNKLVFAKNSPFDAEWIRKNRGTNGVSTVAYDVDGDGLIETRVATVRVLAEDVASASPNDATKPKSDFITVNVLIEEVNEAPKWSSAAYSIPVLENINPYTLIGSVLATDNDGQTSELRYVFANANVYLDQRLGIDVTKSADGMLLMGFATGIVYVSENGALDFDKYKDSPPVSDNVIQVFDRNMGRNTLSAQTSLRVDVGDVDEPHSLKAPEVKNIKEWGPGSNNVGISQYDNPVYRVREALADPESNRAGNIKYSFGDGTLESGFWRIDPNDGAIWSTMFLDYEALTNVTEYMYDSEGNETVVYRFDPSLAQFHLSVKATNSITGDKAFSVVDVTVSDVNEGPTFYSYNRYDNDRTGHVYTKSNTEYWIKNDTADDGIVQIMPSDPEGTSRRFTYSISNLQMFEYSIKYDGHSGIGHGYPTLWVSAEGIIGFEVQNDGEWEGGTNINGVRRELNIDYNFMLNITDDSGVTSSTPFKITFLREGRTSPVPPIVLDLDGDGIELVSLASSSTMFDMDQDGVVDRTGWVGADDGILAIDRNGDGAIGSVDEISFRGDVEGAISDLEGLRAFDSNEDGVLNAADERFGEFQVWQDLNQDGVSQKGELRTLTEAGISEIGLTLSVSSNESDDSDNSIYATGSFVKADGSIGLLGDVFLAYEPSRDDALEDGEDNSGYSIPAQSEATGSPSMLETNVNNTVDDEAVAAPIILDLDKDGKTVTPLAESQTVFDTVGDGKLRKTAWLDSGDGFLVLDRNGNGKVDDIRDISFVADKAGAKTDLEGLTAFDSNGDGALDAQDDSFVGFAIWKDANANGVTDAGEMFSLAQANINSIDLRGTATGQTAEARANGQSVIFNTGSFTMLDATIGSFSDVGLAYATRIVGQSTVANVTFTTPGLTEGRKGDRFRIRAAGGSLSLRSDKVNGAIDAEAGRLGPAALLTFADKTVGMLGAIVLDLDGDGLEVQSRRRSSAKFDMDGDGIADDTGWVGKGDGLLVIDRNSNGQIDGPGELTFLTEKAGLTSSFAGLATLDANRDGKLDKTDARFSELKVWVDGNRDGVAGEGELRSLTELGIASLSLRTTSLSSGIKPGDNIGLTTATYTRTDGTVVTMGEAALGFAPSSMPHGTDQRSDALGGASLVFSDEAEPVEEPSPLRNDPFESLADTGASTISTVVNMDAARMIEAMSSFGAGRTGMDHLAVLPDDRQNAFVLAAAR